MERSFSNEINMLKLGNGEEFFGEGILAVTKALLQSGVSYVGGYQGAPVSHLLDVMVQAKDYLSELGVCVEACTNEASAAAMLGASISYPVRGAVTWKSIVGTNVAADALSNLASPGVIGGALIVVGEDYGEGSSIIQERTHSIALKSGIWLLDPRPNLETIVSCVENAFELSEISNAPVMLELRIRACHIQGSFISKDNKKPTISKNFPLDEAASHDYHKISHPPSTYLHEKEKYDKRKPNAQKYIIEKKLNEIYEGEYPEIGIIVQGGLYNSLHRAIEELGLVDNKLKVKFSLLILNVVYPLVDEEIINFVKDKKSILVVEEGQPEFIEHEIGSIIRRARLSVELNGKNFLPMAGEYTPEVLCVGLSNFLQENASNLLHNQNLDYFKEISNLKDTVKKLLGDNIPPRPPGFCVGCPERPFFSALKMLQKETGKIHVSTDIGCHSFATFPPFSFGNSILGYGMSLASSAGVQSFMNKRPISIMGDGGFWHNGMLSGVASRLLNGSDGILVILKNGYTSATGTQDLLSTPKKIIRKDALDESTTSKDTTIEKALYGVGVEWVKTVHTYNVGDVKKVIKSAMDSKFNGLKVIVAEGECQLERQRRLKPILKNKVKKNLRIVKVRYGVDEETCTGDHSCIRLSGCPTLTIKAPKNKLKIDPVAYINEGCVGCGLCGENAIEASLCPSFWRAEVITNPKWYERFVFNFRKIFLRSYI